jgi:hypothetical protein
MTKKCNACGREYELVGSDEESSYGLVNAGNYYMTDFLDTEKAFGYFARAAERNPNVYYAWWGMIRAKTKDFTYFDINTKSFEIIKQYLVRAQLRTPKQLVQKMNDIF